MGRLMKSGVERIDDLGQFREGYRRLAKPLVLEKDEVFFGFAPDFAMPRLIRVARETWHPSFVARFHRQGVLRLFFIRGGRGVFTLADEEHDVLPGDLVVVTPSMPGDRLNSHLDTVLELDVFVCTVAAVGQTLRDGVGERTAVHRLAPDVDVFALLDVIINQAFSTKASEELVLELLRPLLRMAGWNARGRPEEQSPSLRIFERARQHIRMNIGGPLSVEDVARAVGVSPSHLYRVFQRHQGCPTQRFLNDARMQFAASELSQYGTKIEALARQLGYSDGFAFSKAFKRYWGRPPSR